MLFLSSEFLLDTFNDQVSLQDRSSRSGGRWGWREARARDLGLNLPHVDLAIDNYFII